MLKAFFEYDCRTYISHISGNVDCMVGVSMVPATTILVIATNNKRKSKHYSNTDHAICIIFNKYEILYEHMDTHKQKLSLSVITFNSKCGFRFNLNFKIEHQIQTEMKPQSEIFRWLKRSRPLEKNAYYFLFYRTGLIDHCFQTFKIEVGFRNKKILTTKILETKNPKWFEGSEIPPLFSNIQKYMVILIFNAGTHRINIWISSAMGIHFFSSKPYEWKPVFSIIFDCKSQTQLFECIRPNVSIE